ncbi:MAG TPA: caspase family protein [Kofleriaceae bacterium]
MLGRVGHALVVGSPGETLKGVDHDVRNMAAMLRARGFAVDVRTGDRATRDGILAGYNDLIASSRPDQPAVFYYSGHGFHAVLENEQPRSWQGIAPTDMPATDTDDFRGITAWELSIKQAQLTRRTRNVTVILDCCHAAQMSRDAAVCDAVPRALPHPYRRGFAVHLEALRETYRAAYAAVDPVSNRDAVRLVACGQDESAFEYRADGEYRGVFTEALLDVLGEVGDARVSWRAIEGAIRTRVHARFLVQRPDIEGPARRRPFLLDEDDVGDAVMIDVASNGFTLKAGRLMGVVEGDVFGVMPSGSRAYRAGDAIAEVTVVAVSAISSMATLRTWHHGRTELPLETVAFPIEKRSMRRPVRVDAPAADRDRVGAAIAATGTLQVVGPGEHPALATLRLDGGVLTIEDRSGPLFPATRFPDDLSGTVKNLANMGTAQAVRELDGEHGVCADEVDIEWGAVDGGQMRRMPECGGALALRDKVYVRIRSKSQRTLYAHVFNIGLRGRITLLTEFSPAGVALNSEGPDFVLGERHDGTLLGLALGWPVGMPRDTFPRLDEIVVIVTSARTSLRNLETIEQHVASRSASSSKLQDLLAQLQDGLPRTVRGAQSADGFFMKRLTYLLHPRDTVMADIPFELDDNPLRQAAARMPGAWIVPGERLSIAPGQPGALSIRIIDLVIEDCRALSRDLRMDALVCTRSRGAGSYTTWTRRYRGVRAGDRLDVGGGAVFRGSVLDFVDIYLWASRDSEDGLTLEQLLAQRAASPEIRDAADALAMRIGARTAPWISAVGGSAVLSRAAYELLGGAGKSIGIYRSCFVAGEGFGVGRHPVQGLLRTREVAFSMVIESIVPEQAW